MSIAGTWNITLHGPTGPQKLKFVADVEGDVVTGKITNESTGDSPEIKKGKVDGNNATWDLPVTKPMPLTLGFNTTVDGDKITGTAKLGMFGSAKIDGTRA